MREVGTFIETYAIKVRKKCKSGNIDNEQRNLIDKLNLVLKKTQVQ